MLLATIDYYQQRASNKMVVNREHHQDEKIHQQEHLDNLFQKTCKKKLNRIENKPVANCNNNCLSASVISETICQN